MTAHRHDRRAARTGGLSDLRAHLDEERRRILKGANPERRAQLRRAERSREIYRAWNEVCGATREGNHVTGLHYLPDSNELLVYLDAPSWTQELTMLREIIRGRMARAGAELDGFVFKTSRKGYAPPSSQRNRALRAARPDERATRGEGPLRTELSDAELAELDEATSTLRDEKLREALRKAIRASLEWKKGKNGADAPSGASGGLVEH